MSFACSCLISGPRRSLHTPPYVKDCYIRIMKKETGNYYIIIVFFIGVILGLYMDNGNDYIILGFILGLFRGNGKENGNYCSACPILHRQP